MTTNASSLGPCPFCGAAVADKQVIVEYETSDGETAVWAECPDCRDIVDPL
jgi:hypothetical protein